MEPFVVHFDGGSRSTSRRAGCGAVLFNPFGTEIDTALTPLVFCTSNVAEYNGLLLALEMARRWRIKDLIVRGDSKLVIDQMTGAYRVHAPHLRVLKQKAIPMLDSFETIVFEHVPRAQNARADTLANIAMDMEPPAQTMQSM